VNVQPRWHGLSFQSLEERDRNLPPEQQLGLIQERADGICAFLGQPEGHYRSRKAAKILTKKVPLGGVSLAMIEKSGGRYRAREVRLGKSEYAESFLRFACSGIR
jgi:hypothetical protein